MPANTRSDPAATILPHWAMLLPMAAVYAAIELRQFFPKGSDIKP